MKIIIVITVSVFGVLLIFFLPRLNIIEKIISTVSFRNNKFPELKLLEARQHSFQELAKIFANIAEEKGAVYAFEVLKIAKLPPQTDMHLMGHVVGDVLYKQKGLEGIAVCTHDFRNACSHSIVVGLLLDKGEAALPEISQACRLAPGGSGAYTMCYHGLGHGILSYVGYDLVKAASLCERTGTKQANREEYVQCVGGTIMEIISGGGHNKEQWSEKHKEYIGTKDPLYPCSASFIPNDVKEICYIYLTPALWIAAGGTIADPTPEIFEKSFRYCDRLSEGDMRNRDACFGGFGKEYIALVRNRDIRNVDQMTDEQLARMYDWCLLAPHKMGRAACVVHGVNSLFWGGENDRSVSLRFCATIRDAYLGGSCYMSLIGAASIFIKDRSGQEAFCNDVPQEFTQDCRARVFK